MSFQILHGEVPNFDFAKDQSGRTSTETFYGITDKDHFNTGVLRSDYADDEVNRKDVSLTKTQRPYNISPELGGLEASTDEELSVDDLVS